MIAYKNCLKCKYFIPHLSIDVKEIVSKGKCYKNKRFCNIINEFDYDYIKDCRQSDIKCGRKAKYFEESILQNKIKYTKYIAYQPYIFIAVGSTIYSFYIIKLFVSFI